MRNNITNKLENVAGGAGNTKVRKSIGGGYILNESGKKIGKYTTNDVITTTIDATNTTNNNVTRGGGIRINGKIFSK